MPKKTVQDMILEEIQSINGKLDQVLEKKIPELEGDVKVLKYKSSVFGAVFGIIGGIVTYFIPRSS
jgi:hypothetical protein